MPIELLKLVEEENIQILVGHFNAIYKYGKIPNEWLKTTFVTLPKKNKATQCAEYKTTSLMSHALKIFLKIIHKRIYNKLEEDVSPSQFGFRSGLGTPEAQFALNMTVQRSLKVNKDMLFGLRKSF